MIAAATTNSTSKPVGGMIDLASLGSAAVPASQQLAPEVDLDIPLVRRCKKGDMHAYRQLVERHERRVISILSRVLSGRHSSGHGWHSMSDVEDLAQDVFVQAWRALPSFRGEARFSTWLYRIATNRAIKEWRRSRRFPGDGWSESEIDDDRGAAGQVADQQQRQLDPEILVQLNERCGQLRGAIDALPERQRIVVLLHYFEEYSCEEIAQILGCSVGTIWSRLHYACRKLRCHLSAVEAAEAA